jgi:membrane fusion protein (multidrug efflux system)
MAEAQDGRPEGGGQGQPPPEAGKGAVRNNRRKKFAITLFLVVAVLGALSVFFYLRYKSTHVGTDDAYIDGNVYTVAARVPGTVRKVYVDDNQDVAEGELLVELDPTDYQVRVREALSSLQEKKAKVAEMNAKVQAARKALAETRAAMEASQASVSLQEARLAQAEKDRTRARNLHAKEAISTERYEKAMTDYDVVAAQAEAARKEFNRAGAAVKSQEARVGQAEAEKASEQAGVKQAEAALEQARLNLGYTKVHAAAAGHVTKKSVEAGNRVQAGQPLMSVVSLEGVWVVANYKETDLQKIRPGQRVEIEVDTFPGKVFRGKVQSIMAGTGAVFSLFPPENATGNYVKVVQRIPVKIVFDEGTDAGHVLRIGMSVVPTVIVE